MTRILAVVAIMALLGACSSAQADDGPSRVEITIHHSRFDVATLDVRAGQTVIFTIINEDPIDHEFILGDREVQNVHEEGTEAHHGAKPGEISVPAGETAITTYTFGPDDPFNPILFGCHLPAHYDYGMKGTVKVS